MDDKIYETDYEADMMYQRAREEEEQDKQMLAEEQARAEAAAKQNEALEAIQKNEQLKKQPLKDKDPDDDLQEPLLPFEGQQYVQRDGGSVVTDEYRAYEQERKIREIQDSGIPVLKELGQGAGDALFDTVRAGGQALDAMNPSTGPFKDGKVVQLITEPVANFWRDNSPKPKTHGEKLVRDAAAIIIPNVIGSAWAFKGAAALTTAGTKARTVANLGAIFGPDLAVTAISSQSTNEHNFSAALNSWLGFKASPWATTSEDSPDVIRWKHLADSAPLSGFGELLGLAFAKVGKKIKYIPESASAKRATRDPVLVETDELIKNEFVSDTIKEQARAARKLRLEDLADPIGEVEIHRIAKEDAMTSEGLRRRNADPMANNGPDPYVNKLDDESAPLQNVDGNPIKAKVDNYRIQNNIGTTDGMRQSATTEYWAKQYMQIAEAGTRTKYLQKLFSDLAEPVSAIYEQGGKFTEMPAGEINKGIDRLVEATLMDDITFDEYVEGISLLKEGLGPKVTDGALNAAFEQVFSPDNLRASAVLTQQFADNVQTASEAMEVIGKAYDTRAHQQLVFQKMQALANEVQAGRFAQGAMTEGLQAIQKGEMSALAEGIFGKAVEFNQAIGATRALSDTFLNEMNSIIAKNPEWAKPMIAVYNATDGNVDTLYKMKQWTEKNLGLFKKSVFDFNDPEVPSQLVQQLWNVKYNAALSGKAALRAFTGNGLMMASKPISAFMGSIVRGDMADFARSTYVYGGIAENFQRGWQEMVSKWKLAVNDPMAAAKSTRQDISAVFAAVDKQEALSMTRVGLRADADNGVTGAAGQLAYLNATEALRGFNNHPLVRYGINALTAADGLARAVIQSGQMRAQAYDHLLKEVPGGVVDPKAFDALQKKLYNQAFGPDGMIMDGHAAWASNELALNLPSGMAVSFENFLKHVPAARALFMFARTGLNAMELLGTFAPGSSLIPGINRATKLLAAQSDEQIIESLVKHGFDSEMLKTADINVLHNALKSEYIGRQMMGTGVVMAGGIYALNGNLTGKGPDEFSERQKMERTGWQPMSIRNPFTGEWHSYEGFEPYDKILSLTATIVNESQRVDQSTAEQWMLQLGWALTSNIGSQTFMSGIHPLAAMYSGDKSAWARFIAMQADQIIPGAGARSVLNNALSPGLKDVERTIEGYFANKWKFLPKVGESLANEVDFYTGEPIRVNDDPINAAVNALLPTFKHNGKIEPWRQWLLKTEWNGLSRVDKDPITGGKMTPQAREAISKYIADTRFDFGDGPEMRLEDKIKLMSENPIWLEQLKDKSYWEQQKGIDPLKKAPVYDELDRIHDIAKDKAWEAYGNGLIKDTGRRINKQSQERQYEAGEFEKGAEIGAENKLTRQMMELLNSSKL